jgi:hypothetical protein
MAVISELATLHRSVEELRRCVGDVRSRYGDIPAVRRIVGDLDRIDLDAAELDTLPAPLPPAPPPELQVIDDRPDDPALWADADDEGVGGYHHDEPRGGR